MERDSLLNLNSKSIYLAKLCFPLKIANTMVSISSLFFFWRKVSSRNVTSLRLSRLSQLDSACELIKIRESIAN